MKKIHAWLLKGKNSNTLITIYILSGIVYSITRNWLFILLMVLSLIIERIYDVIKANTKKIVPPLDTRLLKKMRENWTIIKYNDPLAYTGTQDIYRALYRGKLIQNAWDLDKSQVLLLIAYASKYGNNNIFGSSTYLTPDENVKAYRYERKEERQEIRRKKLIKTLKPVWP